MISYIATGEDASITLYNTPDFTGNEFQHSVIGPGIQAPCSALQRDKDKNWDNAVYSIVLQAWNNCNDNEESFVCSPITTSPPVSSPTHSPFVPPTVTPSHSPIIFPTPAPSSPPTPGPTNHPRARPTMEPLARPTLYPTIAPTKVCSSSSFLLTTLPLYHRCCCFASLSLFAESNGGSHSPSNESSESRAIPLSNKSSNQYRTNPYAYSCPFNGSKTCYM